MALAKVTLRRYTNLASAIHMLDRKVITLLSPAYWDDRNDAYVLNKERSTAKSVLALCFAETFETYHHWRVFASGRDGVCIEFDKQKLLTRSGRTTGSTRGPSRTGKFPKLDAARPVMTSFRS